ncbi:hypothetical protein VTK56DRAFT_7745 [Thermocarpiscus australiensis]
MCSLVEYTSCYILVLQQSWVSRDFSCPKILKPSLREGLRKKNAAQTLKYVRVHFCQAQAPEAYLSNDNSMSKARIQSEDDALKPGDQRTIVIFHRRIQPILTATFQSSLPQLLMW